MCGTGRGFDKRFDDAMLITARPLRTTGHVSILFINLVQYVMEYTRSLRTQVDYVFALHDPNIGNRVSLHDNFFSNVGPFEVFESIFARCTANYGCIVSDMTKGQSTRLDEWIFWYRGSPKPNKFLISNRNIFKLDAWFGRPPDNRIDIENRVIPALAHLYTKSVLGEEHHAGGERPSSTPTTSSFNSGKKRRSSSTARKPQGRAGRRQKQSQEQGQLIIHMAGLDEGSQHRSAQQQPPQQAETNNNNPANNNPANNNPANNNPANNNSAAPNLHHIHPPSQQQPSLPNAIGTVHQFDPRTAHRQHQHPPYSSNNVVDNVAACQMPSTGSNKPMPSRAPTQNKPQPRSSQNGYGPGVPNAHAPQTAPYSCTNDFYQRAPPNNTLHARDSNAGIHSGRPLEPNRSTSAAHVPFHSSNVVHHINVMPMPPAPKRTPSIPCTVYNSAGR
jgi:hypothetical protein